MQHYAVCLYVKLLYMFRVVPPPIIRSAYNCTASSICHTVTATCRYRGGVGTAFAVEKAVCVTYSEFVSVALIIQHAMRMCHVLLFSVACSVLQHFPTLSHKRHDFRKKCYRIYVCFNFLYNFNLKHFSFKEEISEI
jgi:hypothetical protein